MKKEKQRHRKSQLKNELTIIHVAYLAIYLALFIVLSFVPFTGYLRFGIISITIMPVLIAVATFHLGFKGAMISSLGFGMGSWLRALTQGDPSRLFINPLISVAPRIIIGIFVFIIFLLVRNKKTNEIKLWHFFILASSTALLNSFFVISSIYLWNYFGVVGITQTIRALLALIWLNIVLEFIFTLIVATPLYILIKVIKRQN